MQRSPVLGCGSVKDTASVASGTPLGASAASTLSAASATGEACVASAAASRPALDDWTLDQLLAPIHRGLPNATLRGCAVQAALRLPSVRAECGI